MYFPMVLLLSLPAKMSDIGRGQDRKGSRALPVKKVPLSRKYGVGESLPGWAVPQPVHRDDRYVGRDCNEVEKWKV
jgi:hypothetical protein